MTKPEDATPVIRVGGYPIERRWESPRRFLPAATPGYPGHYDSVIVLDDDTKPHVDELHVYPKEPSYDAKVTFDLNALARFELWEKWTTVAKADLAAQRGGVSSDFVNLVEARTVDDLVVTPEVAAIEKEASTIVYGRKRGARMDPVFLEGVAKMIVDRPERTSKTDAVRAVAKRFDVNEGTVWRWLREAGG